MYITALQQIRGIEETHRKMEKAMGESFWDSTDRKNPRVQKFPLVAF